MRACSRGFCFFVMMASAACSSSTSDAPAEAPPAAPDATPAPAPAADPPAPVVYPAFRPAPPQLALGIGKVLASPKFQVIAYAGDPSASFVSDFVASVGASAYWTAAVHEYGIGAATALPSVTVTDAAPQTIDDTAIASWLASEIESGAVAAPDGETVYVIAYPEGTTVTSHGETACTSAFGAYHAEATGSVPYVVLPRCASYGGLSGNDEITLALSHELIEAAANPLIATAPALEVDDAHAAWRPIVGGELGDLCEGQTTTPEGFGFVVQRVWSNAAASAGHHPCVPAPARPYFNAAPVVSDTAMIAGEAIPAVKVGVGQTRTIDLQLFSDQPAPAWKVEVLDGAKLSGKPAQLALSLDRTSGKNGDVLHVTIEALARGRTGTVDGLSVFAVRSTSATDTSYWMALVVN